MALFWGSRESQSKEQAGTKQGQEEGNQAVQGSAHRPHLFSRVPCCSRMTLVSLQGEELASGSVVGDRQHIPHMDAGCRAFVETSSVIFC